MRIPVISTLAALHSFGVANAQTCTETQAADFTSAIAAAVEGNVPSSFESAEAYYTAIETAAAATLESEDLATDFPCYTCLQTYSDELYACGDSGCTDEQKAALETVFTTCLEADTSDAVKIGTISAAVLGLAVVLL